MDHHKIYGTVDIMDTLPVLAKSKRACEALQKALGPGAVQVLDGDGSDKDLIYSVCDFFMDEILNESRTVYEGELENDYPVGINEYEGIFYVWSPECDDTGYFLTKESAEDFIEMNW